MTQFYVDYELASSESSKLDEVFMLGYDAWADGASTEVYLKGCHASKKYQQGTWQVLEKEGEIVSALILYNNGFNLPVGSYGIGSVATLLNLRNTGLASKLIQRVIGNLRSDKTLSFYLFSDIDLSFYERLGFAVVKNREREGLMVRSSNDQEISSLATDSIGYF